MQSIRGRLKHAVFAVTVRSLMSVESLIFAHPASATVTVCAAPIFGTMAALGASMK
jgi:hypothetical protein